MREILFRGKRADNGEWVYGNLFIPDYPDYPTEICIGTNIVRITYDVIPKTVGQFTGLIDKNRKKIFDGDIAKFKRFGDTCIGKIIFNQKTGGFEFWWNVTVGAYGEKATYRANLSVCDDIEVIGNIHDNFELLEQDE